MTSGKGVVGVEGLEGLETEDVVVTREQEDGLDVFITNTLGLCTLTRFLCLKHFLKCFNKIYLKRLILELESMLSHNRSTVESTNCLFNINYLHYIFYWYVKNSIAILKTI